MPFYFKIMSHMARCVSNAHFKNTDCIPSKESKKKKRKLPNLKAKDAKLTKLEQSLKDRVGGQERIKDNDRVFIYVTTLF